MVKIEPRFGVDFWFFRFARFAIIINATLHLRSMRLRLSRTIKQDADKHFGKTCLACYVFFTELCFRQRQDRASRLATSFFRWLRRPCKNRPCVSASTCTTSLVRNSGLSYKNEIACTCSVEQRNSTSVQKTEATYAEVLRGSDKKLHK